VESHLFSPVQVAQLWKQNGCRLRRLLVRTASVFTSTSGEFLYIRCWLGWSVRIYWRMNSLCIEKNSQF
jgi:hypothetical protein